MKRVQKKAKEELYCVAEVKYTDGSIETVNFYDSAFSAGGVSFMLLPKGNFRIGKLGVGEIFIPWSNVKWMKCCSHVWPQKAEVGK